ncbi:DUF6193 family natural product biosynthesis protein [Actinoplanes regularis]|uniref:DUF6193 family natural product biosynthesis protein n=1 Tax=Actinoplanes regularis TaxID=52697 RepID=UPI0024A0B4D5|nr:DUF6193 family natural product biosynthesis protein [Actinoplanes regularis]GLW34521.1 hypothetical protein Areg01_74580 [Actinoplanes regularis]
MPETYELDHSRYPDVTAAGDLRGALQDTFDSTGIPLRAQHVESPGWVTTHAVVRVDDREAYIHLVAGDRAFGLSFWLQDFQMAGGRTANLREAASAIALFLAGTGLRDLSASRPFVRFGPVAEAFERGAAEAIAARWRQLLDAPPARARHLHRLQAFLVAAADEPRLRALYPFTSHHDLGFRQSVPSSRSRALAWVRPYGEDRYLISGPDRRLLHTAGSLAGALGPATARESVPLVLAAMTREARA